MFFGSNFFSKVSRGHVKGSFADSAGNFLPSDREIFSERPRKKEKTNLPNIKIVFKIFLRTRKTQLWQRRQETFDKRPNNFDKWPKSSKKQVLIWEIFFSQNNPRDT